MRESERFVIVASLPVFDFRLFLFSNNLLDLLHEYYRLDGLLVPSHRLLALFPVLDVLLQMHRDDSVCDRLTEGYS